MKTHDHLLFPCESDLNALVEDLDAGTMRRLMASQGIFAFGSKESIAPFLSRFAFNEKWYANAFAMTEQGSKGVSVTGARVDGVDVAAVEAALRVRIDAPLRAKYAPKVTNVFARGAAVVAQVSYSRTRPHRTRILQREDLQIDVTATDIGSGGSSAVELLAHPAKATDSLVVREVLTVLLADLKATATPLDIEGLPLGNRVSLFDRVRDAIAPGTWRVGKISGLTVRHDGGGRDAADSDVSDSDVKVLNAAVLEGSNLRDHELVEKFIEKDYFFSSMRFWATNPACLEFNGDVQVEIAFKRHPAVVLVTASRGRTAGEGSRMEPATPPPELAREVATFFWRDLFKHFAAETATVKQGAKGVKRSGAIQAAPPPSAPALVQASASQAAVAVPGE